MNGPNESQSLSFNLTNGIENHYLGMAETNSQGIAKIESPCDITTGSYDIIANYKGDSINSKKQVIHNKKII